MCSNSETINAKEDFMRQAICLARLGGGHVNPNPQVGCVIVRDGKVIGTGYHRAFGQPHAEREALADCIKHNNSPQGASVYVTLEPCAHTGKTPPCTDALIEAGVACVIVGSSDPNPLVSGIGLIRLEKAGIHVERGFLKDECDALNEPFFHYITTHKPLVIAKYAMTLDGKFATKTGKSRWITSEKARRRVHEDRARFASVLVGVETAIKDDPMLNVRLQDFIHTDEANFNEQNDTSYNLANISQPARICVDTHLRLPHTSRLVQSAHEQRTIIITCNSSSNEHLPYLEAGCEVYCTNANSQGHVDLNCAINTIGELGLDSVIIEGGPTLLEAAFDAKIVDKVQTYIAPKVFAGSDEVSEATVFDDTQVERIGNDYLIEAKCSKVIDTSAADKAQAVL